MGQRQKYTLASLAAMVGLAVFTPPTFAGVTSYKYDPLGRVVEVDYTNGSVVQYTYDAAGNRVATSVNAPASAPATSAQYAFTATAVSASGNCTPIPNTAMSNCVYVTGYTNGNGIALTSGSPPCNCTLSTIIYNNIYTQGPGGAIVTRTPNIILQLNYPSGPSNSGWTSISIPGVGTLQRSAASYSVNGSIAQWYWSPISGAPANGVITLQ